MDELDAQAAKLYVMERIELRGHCRHKLPLRLLNRYARKFCKLYDVPMVSIRVYAVRGQGGHCDGGRIQLDPKCGMNGLTLAHELAHHIVDTKHPRAQPHGAIFAMYYGALLHGLRLVPFEGFKAICDRHKVRIAHPKIATMWSR